MLLTPLTHLEQLEFMCLAGQMNLTAEDTGHHYASSRLPPILPSSPSWVHMGP